MTSLLILVTILFSFMLGSLPTGYLLVRLVRGMDVRKIGSGNIGATNVARAIGPGGWVTTVLLDAGKGATAVVVAGRLAGEDAAAAAAVAAVVGHCHSPWLGLKGGKGVATMFGTFVILAPWATAVSVGILLLVTVLVRFMSVGSLVAAAMLPLSSWWVGESVGIVMAGTFTALLVWFRHAENLRRLCDGSESRIWDG